MDIIGDRKFVEVRGPTTHELPPVLVRGEPQVRRRDRVMGLAGPILESEDVLPQFVADAAEGELERRRMDLAINLVDQYLGLVKHWQWGDGILEWIRQCETTFDQRLELRNLLHYDVWPHAGRTSFVKLLNDKAVRTEGLDLAKAAAFRPTFPHPPPIPLSPTHFP